MTTGRTSPTLEERQAITRALKRLGTRLSGFENINHRLLADLLWEVSGNVLCAVDTEEDPKLAARVANRHFSELPPSKPRKRIKTEAAGRDKVLELKDWRRFLTEDRGFIARKVEELRRYERSR